MRNGAGLGKHAGLVLPGKPWTVRVGQAVMGTIGLIGLRDGKAIWAAIGMVGVRNGRTVWAAIGMVGVRNGRTVWAAIGMVGLGLGLLGGLSGLAAEEGPVLDAKGNIIQRVAQPKVEDLRRGEKVVEEVLGRDIAKARARQEKAKLAQEILRLAREEQDMAVRFAALQTARKLAVEAMDGKLGLEIVQEIVQTYKPPEEMSQDDRLAEADRLWQQAERSQGRERLAKQLEAVEQWLYADVKTGLVVKKWEDRITLVANTTGIIKLEAKDAKCCGTLRYAPEVDSIGWWENANDYVEWTVFLLRGEYQVTVSYGHGWRGTGSIVGISFLGAGQEKSFKTLPFEVKTAMSFIDVSVGRIKIMLDGEYVIRLHVLKRSPTQKYIMQPQRISLEWCSAP